MKESAIGWCDFSGGDLNFVTGCTPISEGCQNCYARAIYKRFGRDFDTVQWHADKFDRLCNTSWPQWSPKRGEGTRPMLFACDTGDLFHEDVPDYRVHEALFRMSTRKGVIWQVLTKRPERMRLALRTWQERGMLDISKCQHIWLGVTTENQQRADERIPILLDTPAAVRFVSVEPMLGPMELCRYLSGTQHLDWVICGAESGPSRRPFDVGWAQALYEQCKDACVPFFGKQDSALKPGAPLYIRPSAGSEIAGVVHEWPQ